METEIRRKCQVTPPVPSLFTRFRSYLAHFFPVCSRFLRVFTVSARRFQRSQSRNQAQETAGTRAKRGELPPSFDTPAAVRRINWSGAHPMDTTVMFSDGSA
eukprot:COSAG04_NODE_201_length_20457_cov_316.186462_11_plen_102_part_00